LEKIFTITLPKKGEEKMGKKGYVMLDIDSALVPNTNVNGVTKPPKNLLDLINEMSRKGYFPIINTGQSIGVANQYREFLNVPECWVVVEHGNILYKNSIGTPMLKKNELKRYISLKSQLKSHLLNNCATIADAEIMLIGEILDNEVLKRTYRGIPEDDAIDKFMVEIDSRINVVPRGIDKSSIFPMLNGPIVIAAGDSGSDIPMLEKAEWPIVTHENGIPDKKLVKIVREKGAGYIAKPHELTGKGVYRGILEAIIQGVVKI
jgi:hydroxymethylpyrimidine pyrophosphatase-like HAD family hydrolase